MPKPPPEPWLRGPLPGLVPQVSNLFYTFVQAREELDAALDGLTAEEIWSRPMGLAPVGFHVRHMGGATERLGAYLGGRQLTEQQLADMRAESTPGAGAAELMAELRGRQEALEVEVRGIDPARLDEVREVGRAKLPTTVIGLIVHIAEHSQRHLGQAITTAKLVRALREQPRGGARVGPAGV